MAYNRTALATFDSLLAKAPPALRAWLLTPVGHYPWGQQRYPNTPPAYTYARIADALPWNEAKFTDDMQYKILRENLTRLYVARVGWTEFVIALQDYAKAYDKAWKAVQKDIARDPKNPVIEATRLRALLSAFADVSEGLEMLRKGLEMLDYAIWHGLTSYSKENTKAANALRDAVTRLWTPLKNKINLTLGDFESALGPKTLTRMWSMLAIERAPPPAMLRDFTRWLDGDIEDSRCMPRAVVLLCKSVEGAMFKTAEKWEAYLTALDPKNDGLAGLRLPFGRPSYTQSDALANRRKLSLEGFDLTYNGEIDVPRRIAEEIQERMRPVLLRYRRQAERYFPALYTRLTPHLDVWFYNPYGEKTPWGHHYFSGRGIGIYPRNMPWFKDFEPTTEDRDVVVQVIAHEAGHDMWKKVMNERQREGWTELITQQTPIDYDAILAAFDTFSPLPWPPEPPPAMHGWKALPYIPNVDPAALYGARWPQVHAAWKQYTTGLHHYAHEDITEPLEKASARLSARRDDLVAHGYDVSPIYYREDTEANGYRHIAFYVRKAGEESIPARRWSHFDRQFRTFGSVTEVPTVGRILPMIRDSNPFLAIQIEVASSIYDPDYTKKSEATAWRYMNPSKYEGDPRPLFWYTRNEVKALRDKQEKRNVPLFPVTGYAATNPEEAWCDAFGNLIAYGPRKLLEPVRELIYRLFPTIRRNPAEDVDTDT